MIYLATPYSDPQSYIRQLRYAHAMHVAAELTKLGNVVYSPVVHFHQMALVHQLPTTFDFWDHICLAMLEKANELYVLKLDNWKASIGVTKEVEFALDHSIPVTYLEADEWLK